MKKTSLLIFCLTCLITISAQTEYFYSAAGDKIVFNELDSSYVIRFTEPSQTETGINSIQVVKTKNL